MIKKYSFFFLVLLPVLYLLLAFWAAPLRVGNYLAAFLPENSQSSSSSMAFYYSFSRALKQEDIEKISAGIEEARDIFANTPFIFKLPIDLYGQSLKRNNLLGLWDFNRENSRQRPDMIITTTDQGSGGLLIIQEGKIASAEQKKDVIEYLLELGQNMGAKKTHLLGGAYIEYKLNQQTHAFTSWGFILLILFAFVSLLLSVRTPRRAIILLIPALGSAIIARFILFIFFSEMNFVAAFAPYLSFIFTLGLLFFFYQRLLYSASEKDSVWIVFFLPAVLVVAGVCFYLPVAPLWQPFAVSFSLSLALGGSAGIYWLKVLKNYEEKRWARLPDHMKEETNTGIRLVVPIFEVVSSAQNKNIDYYRFTFNFGILLLGILLLLNAIMWGLNVLNPQLFFHSDLRYFIASSLSALSDNDLWYNFKINFADKHWRALAIGLIFYSILMTFVIFYLMWTQYFHFKYVPDEEKVILKKRRWPLLAISAFSLLLPLLILPLLFFLTHSLFPPLGEINFFLPLLLILPVAFSLAQQVLILHDYLLQKRSLDMYLTSWRALRWLNVLLAGGILLLPFTFKTCWAIELAAFWVILQSTQYFYSFYIFPMLLRRFIFQR